MMPHEGKRQLNPANSVESDFLLKEIDSYGIAPQILSTTDWPIPILGGSVSI